MGYDFSSARSVLSVPGHDERKAVKAHDRGADLVLWDLEDSVPASAKSQAREIVVKYARSGDCVRVSAPTSSTIDAEIEWATGLGLAIMVPKVESWNLGVFGCILSIETPSAVLDARAIAQNSAGIAFGRYDFMAACGISEIWSPLVSHAMMQVALAAMAAGVSVSDAPCYTLTGDEYLIPEIERAKSCGFTSKCCIHPNQIAACNSRFGLSAEDLARESALIASWQEDRPISVRDGKMIGPPDLRRALWTVSR